MVKDNVTNLDAEVRPYWEDVAERELGETAEVKRKCLAEIRVLISDDSLLRCPTDDAFLLKFLRVRKYRVTDAFRTIRCYFRVRKEHPEIFKDLRPDSFSYDSLVRKHRLIFYLKERDSLGRAVCCLRLGAWNTSICPIMDLFRATIVFTECSLTDQETQVNGIIALVDFKGLQLYHFRYLVPILRIIMHLIQECYPLRLKGLFCVNCPRLVETLLALTRPFLKSKLLSRIHILRNDYKKVHDLVPPQVLPPEFCGTHQEYDVDSLEAGLHSQRDYFEKIEKYGYHA